ncbi:MAG: tetratricopeptide repeat protein [Terriglobia bacterium]
MKRAISWFLLLCVSAVVMAAPDPAGRALIKGSHWKRLRALAGPRVAANANDAEAAFLLAYAKLAFGDLEGAQALADKAASLDGRNADPHFLLARVAGQKAQKAGMFKGLSLARQFKKESEVTLSLNPNHVEALLDLMDFCYEAPGIVGGDKKKSWEIADRIGKINPARGYLAQASLLYREKAKDWSKIEDLYRKASAADPRNYEAHMALANLYASEQYKKYDESEKLAREAMVLDPGHVGAYSLLAILDVLRDRWQDLDALLAQAEKAIPDNLNPHYQAGRVMFTAGKDLPRAERYFRKYLTQEPEGETPHWAAAHWRLGLTLEKQGRKPEAIAELEAAFKLEPDFEPAKKDLRRLK